ncbi:hypothetical protein [Caballeronia cordobensis]|uniref:hypothetical protein n=1 Tax=Caballeronia cordobensis TaxID=1353886 RepID=UPI001F2B4CAB|nr:hypothetical protein [Caballeronia cordobensis]
MTRLWLTLDAAAGVAVDNEREKDMTKDDKKILDDQIRRWTTGINDLAAKIAAAKGTTGVNYALILVTPEGDYEDVAPELIAEDALRVMNHGWPDGFDIEILNRSN